MRIPVQRLFAILVTFVLLLSVNRVAADPVPVKHIQGDFFAFLALRDLDGQPIAYGDLKQVVNNDGQVMDDLQFRFKDGSFFEEITKFTQHHELRLVSDQVVQKGPSFKQESETWIDAATGKITVRSTDNGKEKVTNKHLDLPPDVSNGLLWMVALNANPAAPETTVSMVAASSGPRVVKLNFVPAPEQAIKVGPLTYRAQHYIVKTKIKGVAGVIAPIVGKQPPDIHIWIVKSEAPAIVGFEGPLSESTPVWRMEQTVPAKDVPKTKTE